MNQSNEHARLKELTVEFFKILDIVEESDSGKVFHPTFISCCRALTGPKLSAILKEMKELAQAPSR